MPGSSIRLAMAMAIDRNKLIGVNGGMPWHIPVDLKWFKANTLDKPIIMGRKTFDSIGRPLPNRCNIVVSSNIEWAHLGCEHALDLAHAIEIAEDTGKDEAVIIGGAQLCAVAMPHIERLYLTEIDAAFEGDTWLDSYDAKEWQIESEERVPPGEGTDYPLRFLILQRSKR